MPITYLAHCQDAGIVLVIAAHIHSKIAIYYIGITWQDFVFLKKIGKTLNKPIYIFNI